jgi:hypothetical protein
MKPDDSNYLTPFFGQILSELALPVQREVIQRFAPRGTPSQLLRAVCELTESVYDDPDAFPWKPNLLKTKRSQVRRIDPPLAKARARLDISTPKPQSGAGFQFTAGFSGSAALSFKAVSQTHWIATRIIGLSITDPSDSSTIAAIRDTWLRELCRFLGLSAVWCVHQTLAKFGSQYSGWDLPYQMSDRARDSARQVEARRLEFSHYPQSSAILACLTHNDPRLWEEVEHRIREISSGTVPLEGKHPTGYSIDRDVRSRVGRGSEPLQSTPEARLD